MCKENYNQKFKESFLKKSEIIYLRVQKSLKNL